MIGPPDRQRRVGLCGLDISLPQRGLRAGHESQERPQWFWRGGEAGEVDDQNLPSLASQTLVSLSHEGLQKCR